MNKQCVFCYRMVPVTDVYKMQLGDLEMRGNGNFSSRRGKEVELACGSCVEDAKRIFQAKAAIVAVRKE